MCRHHWSGTAAHLDARGSGGLQIRIKNLNRLTPLPKSAQVIAPVRPKLHARYSLCARMAVVPHARSCHALPGWFPLSRVRFQGGIAISEKRWEVPAAAARARFALSSSQPSLGPVSPLFARARRRSTQVRDPGTRPGPSSTPGRVGRSAVGRARARARASE